MVRSLTVTDAAYTALKTQKRPGESFTDAILRVTGRPSLRALSEAMTPRESASLAEAHLATRRERAVASGGASTGAGGGAGGGAASGRGAGGGGASADADVRGRRP